MSRLLLASVMGFVVAASVQADIGPPKGTKPLAITHKITTENEYPDYVFYTVSGNAGFGKTVPPITSVKLNPKTPIELKNSIRNPVIGTIVVAVPKDAAKGFSNDKEFQTALRAGKVEGQAWTKINFDPIELVKDTDKRTVVVREYKVEKIDAKEGLVVTLVKPEDKKDPPKKEGKNSPEDEEVAVASAPRGGNVWIAGLAATLAVVFTGFWLTGRNRRV